MTCVVVSQILYDFANMNGFFRNQWGPYETNMVIAVRRSNKQLVLG